MSLLGGLFGRKPTRSEPIETYDEPDVQGVVGASAIPEPTKTDAVAGLIELLQRGDEKEREEAIVDLWNRGDSRAVPPILAALDDSSWKVRHNAIRAFRYLRDDRAIAPLIQLLEAQGADYTLKAEAAHTLAGLRAVEAIDVLAELHSNASDDAITQFGDRYKGALENALKSLGGLPRVGQPSDLQGTSREVALALKAWYRERAVSWWQSNGTARTAVCDDGNEPLEPGEGFLRPGGCLCCEAHTDALLCNANWARALEDIQAYFGPGLPENIATLARRPAADASREAHL